MEVENRGEMKAAETEKCAVISSLFFQKDIWRLKKQDRLTSSVWNGIAII